MNLKSLLASLYVGCKLKHYKEMRSSVVHETCYQQLLQGESLLKEYKKVQFKLLNHLLFAFSRLMYSHDLAENNHPHSFVFTQTQG